MGLYLILASLVLAVSAGMTFYTKTVTHKQTLVCLFLFPLIYLASGLPLADMTTQILAAVIVFTIGTLYRLKDREIGGGVVYAVTIAVLYIPTLSLLFDYICLAGIIGGVFTLLIMGLKRNTSGRIVDYAAVVMAVGSGFFLYQYSDSASTQIAPVDVQTAATAAAPAHRLRGPSD